MKAYVTSTNPQTGRTVRVYVTYESQHETLDDMVEQAYQICKKLKAWNPKGMYDWEVCDE